MMMCLLNVLYYEKSVCNVGHACLIVNMSRLFFFASLSVCECMCVFAFSIYEYSMVSVRRIVC